MRARMPAPQVDFSRLMVIGVFMGSRSNGCYATGIDSVVRAGGKMTVSRTDTEPGPGVICTLAIVSPAHLVVVERVRRSCRVFVTGKGLELMQLLGCRAGHRKMTSTRTPTQ